MEEDVHFLVHDEFHFGDGFSGIGRANVATFPCMETFIEGVEEVRFEKVVEDGVEGGLDQHADFEGGYFREA